MVEGIIAAVVGILLGAGGHYTYEKKRVADGKTKAEKEIAHRHKKVDQIEEKLTQKEERMDEKIEKLEEKKEEYISRKLELDKMYEQQKSILSDLS